MERCEWCGLQAVLFDAELLIRGWRCYVARFRLCRHCLAEVEE